nr:hypothetical protein [uncultured Butyrivibrio sp.]
MKKTSSFKLFISVLFVALLIGCGTKQVQMPFGSTDVANMQYTDAIKQLKDAGFTNVETATETTTNEEKDNLVKQVNVYTSDSFYFSSFQAKQCYDYNKKIVVYYYIYEKPVAENAPVEEAPAETSASDVLETTSDENVKYDKPGKLDMSDEEYITLIKEKIDGQIGGDTLYGEITLENRVLTVNVKMASSYGENGVLPVEDVAESYISSITDSILEIDDSYWDRVIVDFGSVGIFTGEKEDIINGEYGRYFDMPFLDKNKELYAQETLSSSEPLTTLQMSYAWAIAKQECDKYLSGVNYPKADYVAVKFDSAGAVMVMSKQIELKSKDEKQTMLFVFTPGNEDFDLLSDITVHYLSVAGKEYINDDYCDDFFSSLSQVGD